MNDIPEWRRNDLVKRCSEVDFAILKIIADHSDALTETDLQRLADAMGRMVSTRISIAHRKPRTP